jgi:hypothetical protein
MIAAHNFSPGNVGLVLPSDIIIPIAGLIFLWLAHKHPKSEAASNKLYRSTRESGAHRASATASKRLPCDFGFG